MNKIWLGLRTTLMVALLFALTVSASAAETAAVEGQLTETVSWSLSGGTLTISGTGAMPSFASSASAPWFGQEITALVVGDGITSVGENSFAGCTQITSIWLGKGLRQIHASALAFGKLTAFRVDPENQYFCSDANGLLYSKDMSRLIRFPGKAPFTQFVLPDHVTRIEANAFSSTSELTELTLPRGVAYIAKNGVCSTSLKTLNVLGCGWAEEGAFSGSTNLLSVYLGSDVRNLGKKAFGAANKMTSLTIEPGASISTQAFYSNRSLTTLVIPAGVEVGPSAFSYCYGLTSLTLEPGVKSLGANAFSYCINLPSVHIPAVSGLGESVFAWCSSLHTVTMDEGAFLNTSMFEYCSALRSVTLPEGITRIPNYAFSNCSALRAIELPDTVESIGKSAFYRCDSLESLTLPESLATIGDYAFEDCSSLKALIFLGDEIQNSLDSRDVPKTTNLYYLSERESSGWTTPTWCGLPCYPIFTGNEANLSDPGYYSRLAQRQFSFLTRSVGGKENPVTGASLTVAGQTATANEESSVLAAAIPKDSQDNLLFSKEGMRDVSLPARVLSAFNTVEFYPLEQEGPYVRAVYGSNPLAAGPEQWYDLLHTGMNLTAASESQQTRLYVDVDWNGAPEGTLWLSQHADGSGGWELTNGWCEAEHYAAGLAPSVPVYLVMKDGEGNTCARELRIVVKPGTVEIEADIFPQLDIDEEAAGGVFQSFDMSLNFLDRFKLTFTMTEEGTVQGLFGITVSEDSFKDTYDMVKESMFDPDNYPDLTLLEDIVRHKGGVVGPAKSTSMGVEVNTQFLGWIEGEYVLWPDGKYHLMFKEGAVAFKAEGEATYTYQTVISGMPFYLRPSLNPYVQFTLPVTRSATTGMAEFEPVEIVIHMPVKLAAGLGWDSVLTAGVYGEGGVTLEGQVGTPGMDGWLQASFGAEAEVFCLEADVVLAQTDPWYFMGGAERQVQFLQSRMLAQAQWEVRSRDYLNTSVSEVEEIVPEEETILTAGSVKESPVYPGSDVVTAALSDGRHLAVWQEDDTDRDAANRTVLWYSVYNPATGEWPEPARVIDEYPGTGTADFEPQLFSIGGNVYLVWKNAARPLTAEDTPDTTAAAIDLQWAWFRPKGDYFKDVVEGGTDGYDTSPAVVQMETGLSVVWVSNASNSVFGGEAGSCSIWVSEFSRFQPRKLVDGLNYVDGLAVDANGTIWFTADTDGDPNTLADRELFRLSGEQAIQVTEDQVADTGVTNLNGTIVWYRDSVAVGQGKTLPELPAESSVTGLLSGSNMDLVLYTVDSSVRETTLYAMIDSGTGWGEPLELTGLTGNAGSLSADLLTDGTLSVVVCERPLNRENANYLDGTGYLNHYRWTPGYELVVVEAGYSATSLVPGGQLQAYVQLDNRGAVPVELVNVTVSDAKLQPLSQRLQLAQVDSGESKRMYFSIDLPEDLSEIGSWTVSVIPEQVAEANTDNNTAPLELRLKDLSVEGGSAQSDGTTTRSTVLVANRGAMELEAIDVEMYQGEQLLGRARVDALAPGEGCIVEITGDAVEHLSALTLSVRARDVEPEQENLYSNNTTTLIVRGPEPAALVVQGSLRTRGADAWVDLSVRNTTDGEEVCTLYAAAYDDQGRMLAVNAVPCTAPADSEQVFSLSLDGCADGAVVRVFVLTQTADARLEAQELSLSAG